MESNVFDGSSLYKKDKAFARMINMLAAYNAHQAGASVEEIAQQSGRSVETVKNWIDTVRSSR